MDKLLFSCGVFIDFKKGFGTVDHKILLCKLYHYGFRSVINKRSSSYNTDNSNIASFISEEKIVCLVFHKALSWAHCLFFSMLTISKNVLTVLFIC